MEQLMCGECGHRLFKLFIKPGSYDVPDEMVMTCAKCGAGYHAKPVAHIRLSHLEPVEMQDKMQEIDNK